MDFLDDAELLVQIEIHGHVAFAKMLINGVFVKSPACSNGIDLADDDIVADNLDVVVGHAAQIDAARRIIGQPIAETAVPWLQRALFDKQFDGHLRGGGLPCRFIHADGIFLRGAGDVLQDDVWIVRVEPRLLDGSLCDKVRVVDEILVNRCVFCDIDDDGAAAFSSDAARLLPEGCHRAWMTGKDAQIEIADVDAQFESIRRDDRVDDAVEEIVFEFAAFGRKKAAAIGLDSIRKIRVFSVRDGTVEPFNLLTATTEADRADAELRRLADERNGNG